MSKKQHCYYYYYYSRKEEKRHSSTSINPVGPVHVTFYVSGAPGIVHTQAVQPYILALTLHLCLSAKTLYLTALLKALF